MSLELQSVYDPVLRAGFLRVGGYLDAETADRLQGEVQGLVGRGAVHLVADLSQTSFISSGGVGVFIGVLRVLRQRGGGIVLINPAPPVVNVLEILGIKNLFRGAPDEPAARALLAAAARPR